MANKNYDTRYAYDHRGNIVGPLPFARYKEETEGAVDIARHKLKNNPIDDLKKARSYIDEFIKAYEGEEDEKMSIF